SLWLELRRVRCYVRDGLLLSTNRATPRVDFEPIGPGCCEDEPGGPFRWGRATTRLADPQSNVAWKGRQKGPGGCYTCYTSGQFTRPTAGHGAPTQQPSLAPSRCFVV